jgi:hypothetical protein
LALVPLNDPEKNRREQLFSTLFMQMPFSLNKKGNFDAFSG